MNRLICTLAEPADPAKLPPVVREPGAPARVLFINGAELGFVTTAKTTQHYAGLRADIDAVHFSTPAVGWLRLAGARGPAWLNGWDFQGMRNTLIWSRLLRGVFNTQLPLDRFDVVHIMTQQRAWPVTWLKGRVRAKLAVNIDATVPGYGVFGLKRPPFNPEKMVERKIFAAADMVACASRWCADSVVNDLGGDPGKIVLHKPCARRREGLPFRDHAAGPLRGQPGGPKLRIAFVGNDFVRKGGDKVFAWHQARWSDRVELHICSGLAKPDPAAKSVVWHGAASHEKVTGEVLPNADLFVMPTRVDTFLIAAQEAQAAALPVVTTRIAGIPEVVRDGVTGFLCTRDDESGFIAAIEKLLNDDALRVRMGAAAYAHARANLDPDIWHNHLMDQLVALADGRPLRKAPAGVWTGEGETAAG